MYSVAILGAGGLTGRELIRLLKNHDQLQVVHITSNQLAGKTIHEAYPQDSYKENLTYKTHDAPVPQDATIVLATPNEASIDLAYEFLQKGHKVLDLSGSYRLHNQEIFEKYYKIKHKYFHLMEKVIFGIPEFFRDKIQNSNFVSNPGCYSTSVIIPLRILKESLKINDWNDFIQLPIIVDSKSGVSGAGGRTEEVSFSFTNTYENFRAYKVLNHQHEPEMREYGLGLDWIHQEVSLVFTPHLLPVYRGILSVIYLHWKLKKHADAVPSLLNEFCSKEPFLRYKTNPDSIELKYVQGTNYLDISAKVRGNTTVIVTALDNLLKGASGQALQNLNLMHGLEETKGLC